MKEKRLEAIAYTIQQTKFSPSLHVQVLELENKKEGVGSQKREGKRKRKGER